MHFDRQFFSLHACSALALCFLAVASQAADRPAKFAVAAGQLQALGIQTAPLQTQAEPVKTSFPAQVTLAPGAEQVVSSPLSGLVLQVLVQPNQAVRPGAALIRIASAELGQLQLQLFQATTRATLARQTAQREQALFGEGIIAQRRVQEAQAALREAEAALKQAKTALRLNGMPSATVDAVAASGNPQESIVLGATRAGVVTEIKVKPGQRVDPMAALVHLAQTDVLWLEIQAPVADSAGLVPGTRLKVAGREISAQIVSSGAAVASGSQMVVVRAVVQGKTQQVRPGELLMVELAASATAAGWSLPLAALAHDGDQAYVFVRTPDGFEARPVKVLTSAGQRVRVAGAVKAGEQVAVSGVVALKGAWLDDKGGK